MVRITIDTGSVRKTYGLVPVAAASCPSPFVAGFDLVNRAESPPTAYRVLVSADGAVNCTCPSWQHSERCKHADALVAAGLLPVALLDLLRARTDQLHQVESAGAAQLHQVEAAGLARLEALAADAASDRAVWEHDRERMADQVRQLEADLAAVAGKADQLQRAVDIAAAARPRARRRNAA
jgi:hypothetical protein